MRNCGAAKIEIAVSDAIIIYLNSLFATHCLSKVGIKGVDGALFTLTFVVSIALFLIRQAVIGTNPTLITEARLASNIAQLSTVATCLPDWNSTRTDIDIVVAFTTLDTDLKSVEAAFPAV